MPTATVTPISDKTRVCGKTFRTAKGSEFKCVRPYVNGKPDAKCDNGNHVSRFNERKDVKPLGFKLVMEDVPVTEVVSFGKESGRGEDQLAVDTDMIAAHDAWKQAGRPAITRSSLSSGRVPAGLRKRYIVPPEHAESVETMLSRGATFLKVRVIIAPRKTHEKGHTMIYFAVVDAQERPRKNGNAAK